MKRLIIILIIALYVVLFAMFNYYHNIRQFHELIGSERTFTAMELRGHSRTADRIKFATIVLGAVTAVFLWKSAFDRFDGTMLAIILIMHTIVDIPLTLQPSYRNYVIGMSIYGVIMCLYFIRYNYKRFKNTTILPFFLIIPAILYMLSLNETFLLHGNNQRMMIIVVTFYIQAILAVIYSLIREIRRGRYPKPNAVLLLASITLFAVSDVFVVLKNLETFNLLFFSRLIWVLYTPSQALLAFSAYNFMTASTSKPFQKLS